ncbi:MAG: hypothetical protein II707_10195, partial [Spirochaetales bacterium]|nr:hypothetical protein [Spirochaetales bacterium]
SKITQNSINAARCYNLQSFFFDIPSSANIQADLQRCMNANRLFSSYSDLLQWSSQFLLNKGFTTFSGNHVNQSLLFSVEKLFESFIAHLFKKYAKDYVVSSQHSRYFLVDKYGDSKYGKFRLRPDIVIESKETENFSGYETIILDTKWKNLDKNMPDKNYLIDIKDMYQLYAYGQKYHLGDSYFLDNIPKLVLIYPYTEKFDTKLEPFIYEEIKAKYGLKLVVYPFNLAEEESYKRQVGEIIQFATNADKKSAVDQNKQIEIFDNEDKIFKEDYTIDTDNRYMIVGYYRKGAHLNWILKNKLYNVRFDGESRGSLQGTDLQIIPSRILLYHNLEDDVRIFTVNQSEIMIADKKKMDSLGYPASDEGLRKQYKLFSLGTEIKFHKKINILKLKIENGISVDNYAPFFICY